MSIGIFILFVFIYTGIPFEIKNPTTDVIFRLISFILIFTMLYFLFKQVKKIQITGLRKSFYIVLSLFSALFLIGAMWNDILRGNPHGNWYNLEICTNKSGVKILRQMRETSGSIYDYRDRLVIFEFDESNRISINTNVHYFEGPWIVLDAEKKYKEKVQGLK